MAWVTVFFPRRAKQAVLIVAHRNNVVRPCDELAAGVMLLATVADAKRRHRGSSHAHRGDLRAVCIYVLASLSLIEAAYYEQ